MIFEMLVGHERLILFSMPLWLGLMFYGMMRLLDKFDDGKFLFTCSSCQKPFETLCQVDELCDPCYDKQVKEEFENM